MKLFRRGVASPMFLRIFLTMLACVGVVQLANFALVMLVPPPAPHVYTIGQLADLLEAGKDAPSERGGEFAFDPGGISTPVAWSPRTDRLRLALAARMRVPLNRVDLGFPPPPFPYRAPVFDRSRLPRRTTPISPEIARDVVVIGDFAASYRRPDGSWITVRPLDDGLSAYRLRSFLWLILALAGVAPFAWALSHRLAKPIGAFAAAAERLGRDPRAAPLRLDGPAEIAEAAAAFNKMQGRLNRYVDDRSMMIAAIAHDLRTPLMRMELRLEGAPDEVRRACENDIRDMEAMIATTLAFVRETTLPSARRKLDLRSLAENVTDDMSDSGAQVTLAPGDAIVVEGNPAALKAMFANLITNAVKYAGHADVALAEREGQAVIEVRDDGPGIAAEDLDRVFEPFFRGERSRNRDTGGIGLGLASVRAVARAHGGDVTVENRAAGGLNARVTLPV